MRQVTDTWWWRLLDGSDVPWYEWVGLVVAIVAIGTGIWLIVQLRSIFGDGDGPAGYNHEMLTQIGELHREGELTEEEYRSIKNQLIQQVDDQPSRQDSSQDEKFTSEQVTGEDKTTEDS